ncbi:pyrroline-5-carboxylate reductase [Leptospira wolffii]|uniref:pyrroline-5-carboxylate reductase n=1 Tax=Leptospira wolffii TaxID=409998 RepID=UPI001083B181|nr:pyrroline-5-carboxylate reductase [Leptospira wolffii]TGK60214.1 pyrroline-5-carboxylate reductase [Leptospira wolffii]TGK72556.1 pyrroline-5-carboxylate reductase [Leptospira wolffii]TGK76221.1 pyrroline-5-carboxylate reductase [Leptospira wolffii]TGL30473.1 pyrroline-5-carboxylate reductase [Leptospira wolffii]
MKYKTIGIVGCGNMGGAIYKSLKSRKVPVIGFDPYLDPKKTKGIELETDWKKFQKAADLIVLAVKPGEITKTLESLDGPKDFLSVAAGIPTSTMRKSAPAGSKLVRIMPNLPILVGEGALGYFGDSELYESLREIFSPISYCLELANESLLDAVTGLSGSGPAYVLRFIQSLAEGGVASGIAYPQALELALQTVLGTATLLQKELDKNADMHPELLKNRVTSPGGTTIAGLEELEKNQFAFAVLSAVKRATERSKELGNK